MVTDGLGRPLDLTVTPANEHKLHEVLPILKNIKKFCGTVPRFIVADKGYDADWLRYKLTWFLGMGSVIAKRGTDSENTKRHGRYKAERAFAWMYRRYKRTTQRNERLEANFIGWCHLAVACFWLERVVG